MKNGSSEKEKFLLNKEKETLAPELSSPGSIDTGNIKNPFVIPGIRKLKVDPQLNAKYTFDTFIEGDCNRLARSAGVAVAKHWRYCV